MIGLPRSSYYREGLFGQETPTNLKFMRLIDNEYTAHPFYGTRQIRNALRRKGHKINHKRVQRLMRKMGIQSIAPKPNTSKARPQNKATCAGRKIVQLDFRPLKRFMPADVLSLCFYKPETNSGHTVARWGIAKLSNDKRIPVPSIIGIKAA